MANGIDNNPRSLLYQSLVNNKDKEVSEHFSQWDEKEFDSLLANDKKFQDDLFDDLSSIGVAKDKGQFLKQYTVPKARGVQPKAPAAQPSQVEEKPKDEGRSLLGGIKQFFKSTLADFALPVGVKEAGEEAAKKKIQETGLSERGGGEYGKRPIPIEKDPIFRYETDQQNFKNSQIAREASTGKGTTLDWTKEEEANYQASKKAADDSYKNAQKEINKIIANTLPRIEKSEGTDPNKNIYLKSLATGRTSVNQQMVRDMANKIAVDSGLEPNGMASNLLTTSLSAALQYERDRPEVEAEADRIFKKKYGQGIKDAISTDVQGPSLQKIQEIKTLAKNQAKSAAKIAQMDAKAKMDLESNTYKTAMQSLQAEMDNDADVQTFVSSLDQKAFSRMEELVKAGQITPEEANNILRSDKSMKARQDQVNAFISNKYQPKQLAAYNSYLNKVSELNGRYNLRVRRQIDEIQKGAQKQVDEITSSLKGRKISPVLAARLEETYKSAANIVGERQRGKERAEDVNASTWNNFVNSTISGLAEGIGSTALTFGMNDLAAGADVLASTFKPSDLGVQSWKDVGFSGDKWTRAVMSFGNIGGRMVPGLAASAAMAAGTQGAGLGTLPSLLLTSFTGAAAETADIMGTIEKEVFQQTEGNAVAASEAKAKALESQLKIAPTYLLDGLPFFGKVLKFVKAGRLTPIARAATGMGIETFTETAQEVPQNVFEELIVAGKDPSYKNLYENTTGEKILNTAAQVFPIAPIGGAGHLFDGTMNELARKSAAGYYAKNLLANASHPGLIQQNQTQWLTQLADQKGQRFAGQMVGILLQKGNISKAQANVLASQMERYAQFSEMADRAKMNPVMKQAAFLLYDRAMQAKNSKNTEAADAALQQYNNFMEGNGAELVMVMMPGGNYNVYTYDDFLGVLGNDDFRSAIAEDKSNPNSGSIRITSFDQSPNAQENPKWQQIVKQFNTPVEKPTISEDDVEKDVRIEEAQKRTGFQFTLPLANMPVEYQAIIDAIQNNEEGVTPEEISATQNYLQGISNMMTNMIGVPTRNLTTGQINESLDQINDINEIISQYQNNQILGPETVAQLDEMDAESEQEDADLNEKAAGYTPMMFESESEVPDQYKPLLERATRVRVDGKDMIQIIVPNQMIAQEQAAIEGETAPEVAAPTQPAAPAPQAQPSTVQAPEAPKAMTAKINLFTDDEVYDMLSDKEQKMYDDALFDGNQDAANSIIRAKRKQLLDKEIQLAEVSQVSDKVKKALSKAGINISILSADEFVQKLKEAGEYAERGQEAVFDDESGNIYINKDALQLGWGTTVVWHETSHPIMNIIRNSNKPLYDKILKGILAEAKANPKSGLQDVIDWAESKYAKYGQDTVNDEIIVEALARIAAGTVNLNALKPSLRDQFINLINRIARIFKLPEVDGRDIRAVMNMAQSISDVINGKMDIEDLVGKENIGRFRREGPFTERMSASLSRETQAKVSPGQAVGTRKPTAKKSEKRSFNKDLLIDIESTKANPILYKFNSMLVASYDIMYPVLPPTIKTYLNGVYKTLNKYQNEADVLKDEIEGLKKEIVDITVKQEKIKKTEAEKLATRIISGEVKKTGYGRLISDLKKKMDRRAQLTEKGGLLPKERERVRKEIETYAEDKISMQMADKIYKEFIKITQSNLEALVDLLPARLREVAKLWYDGANLIAQDFAKNYKTSIEQAAAVLAVFSPQKDWFMNISLAERLMNIYTNMIDYKFDDAMASKYLKRSGEPELTIDEKTGEEKWTGGAVPLLDEDGEHIEIDGVLQFKNWDNQKAKERIEKAVKTLNDLKGRSLRELLDSGSLGLAARFVRMYSEVYDSPNFSFYTPDGRRGYESRSEKGTPRKIAWGGYNTIEKALKIMEASGNDKMEVIHNELGEMHKVRSFYNNIADPLSKDGHVTMDTHAIAAILWKGLSGNSYEVAQNFGGAGTKSESMIGSNGLYPVFAEAYREAANNLGYLPREIQSITWEAVRMLFKAKWKGNKENVKKINNIWAKFRNGELTIKEAREQIWKLATAGARGTIAEAIGNGEGVGSPDWAEILDSGLDPEKLKRANDAVRLSMGGGLRYDSERGVGRRGAATATSGVVSGSPEGGKPGGLELGSQKSLGGRKEQSKSESENEREQRIRSERAGDGGVRNIGGGEAPLAGAPVIQGATGPIQELVQVAKEYAKKIGIPFLRQAEYVQADPARGKRIADEYAEMKHDPTNPKVKESYADLIKQTKAQYQALVDAGYEFTFFDENTDPYDGNPFNAMRDLRANKKMAVYGTYDGYGTEGVTKGEVENNPMLEDTGLRWPDQNGVMHPVLANDLFRAVHDAFGHGLEGASFRARGEENAWQAHVRLFTGPAVAAITSETRGQNSWLNFNTNLLVDAVGKERAKELHPDNWETITVGEHNRNAKVNDTIFADQKTGLMPEWTWTEGRAGDMEEAGGSQASLGGRSTAEMDEIVSKAKADGTYLKAPNGKPSNLNEFQWAQVRTKNFKNWFGDWENEPKNASKVVDGNGEPMVVYHGTKNKFDQFEYNKMSWESRLSQQGPGFYMTNNKKAASEYGSPMNVFISLKNPLIITSNSNNITKEQAYKLFSNGDYEYFYKNYLPFYTKSEGLSKQELIKKYVDNMSGVRGFDKEVLQNIKRSYNQDTSYDKMMSDVASILGADGVIEDVTKGVSVYVAFNPNQIKSATENVGAFSTEDARIQFSLGGRAQQAFSSIDKALDMPPVKSKAARAALVDEYGKETVDQMIEITRNFTKIIDGLEEKGVVEKDCP